MAKKEESMRIKRNIVILFIAVIVLIATYAIYIKKDSTINAESNEKKIWNITQDDIVDISMENKNGKFNFKKLENQWIALEPEDLKFDKMRIDGILYTMANLNIKDVINKNSTEKEQYGLENPSIVTIKLKDDTIDTLEIGNVTAFKDGYYVKIKDESTVYKVSKSIGEELLKSKNDFRDKRLFDFVEEEFTGFQLKKEEKILLSINKNDDSWNIEPEVKGNVNLKRLEPIITTLSYLCVRTYVEDSAKDLSKYGLNNPVYTINLNTIKFNKTLYLGNEIEEENEKYIYGKLEGSDDVVLLNKKDISFIDNPSRSGFDFAE